MSYNMGLRYENWKTREDTTFVKRLGKKNRSVVLSPPHYYIRFIHGNNTWPTSHFMGSAPKRVGIFKDTHRDNWDIDEDGKDYLKKILPLYEFQK